VSSRLSIPQGGFRHVRRLFLVLGTVGRPKRSDRRGEKRRQRQIRMSGENRDRFVAGSNVQRRRHRQRLVRHTVHTIIP